MGKIKKIAMSIGSFFTYNEKQFHRFLLAAIILFVVIVCYAFTKEATGRRTFLLYVLIASSLLLVYTLVDFIVGMGLTNYHRKLEHVEAENDRTKRWFETNYITRGFINRPVYEALKTIFSYEVNRGGKNFVQIMYVAKRMGWITREMTYQEAISCFGEDVVGKGSNYSDQTKKNNRFPIDGDEFQAVATMLNTTLEKTEKDGNSQTSKENPHSLKELLLQYLSK